MRGVHNEKDRLEVVRLRVEERLSFREIQAKTNISISSISRWLQNHPITDEELHSKYQAGITKPRPGTRKARGERSKFDVMTSGRSFSTSEKGNIAEAAVLFRLTLYGLHVMAPVFDGGRTDWLVQVPSGSLVKIQVKSARCTSPHGLPYFLLTRQTGGTRYRYSNQDFDFLVGYDLYTDTAYVFSWGDLKGNHAAVTLREDVAEDWLKVVQFGSLV